MHNVYGVAYIWHPPYTYTHVPLPLTRVREGEVHTHTQHLASFPGLGMRLLAPLSRYTHIRPPHSLSHCTHTHTHTHPPPTHTIPPLPHQVAQSTGCGHGHEPVTAAAPVCHRTCLSGHLLHGSLHCGHFCQTAAIQQDNGIV